MDIMTECDDCGKEVPFLKKDGRFNNLCPECKTYRKEQMKTVDIRDFLKRPTGPISNEWPYKKNKKEKMLLLQLLEKGPIDGDTINKLNLNCAVLAIRRDIPTILIRKKIKGNYSDMILALEKDFDKAKEMLNTRHMNWCIATRNGMFKNIPEKMARLFRERK